MIDFDINWLAVLVVVAGSMALGFLWFGKVLFGKQWMAAIGKTEEDLKKGQSRAMTGMVILSIVQVIILAHLVRWVGATTFSDGLIAGLLAWLGFSFTTGMMNGLFAQRSATAVWIEQLYYGVLLAFGGGVLAAWA
ncbi:MAG: DUF1761 domain-containing protein [Candidatus Kerfeldbacteria bacterium]|nr:DUF1761 domain-containing protein [Candidatus Kerfeldbacteria bacterium]